MFWPENPVSDPTPPGVGAAGSPFSDFLLPAGAQSQTRTLPGRKVVIVGCGAVGMPCAVAILHRGCLEEQVLVHVASNRLEGAVMDLCSGLPFLPRTDLRSRTLEEEGRDADQMVINATVASNNQLGPDGSARGQAWERSARQSPVTRTPGSEGVWLMGGGVADAGTRGPGFQWDFPIGPGHLRRGR